jgi:anti-anti-sigma regulatory factor
MLTRQAAGMPGPCSTGTVGTALLPAVLDDVGVAEIRAELHALASDPSYQRIVLDARRIEAISTGGLGLLAAVQLIASRRGASMSVVTCSARIRRRLAVAHVQATCCLVVEVADCAAAPEPAAVQDWTPWWTGAAANA